MVIYSHSRLECYKTCPLSFKFKYLDKLDEISGIEGFLGTQVHEAIHYIYKKVKMSEIPTLGQVLEFYKDSWNKEFKKDLRIVKREFSVKDYFDKGIIFLEKYYEKHKPFNENVIGMEQKILVDLDGTNTYLLQGFIDKLIHNKKEGIYEIHDYKTSNWLKSQEEVDEDNQLALYSIGVKELYPNAKKIILKWHFLNHRVEMTSSRTEKQLEELRMRVITLIKKIEAEKEFPAKRSMLCKWCGFNKICPEYGKLL